MGTGEFSGKPDKNAAAFTCDGLVSHPGSNNIHLKTGPEGNSLDVSRDEVEGNLDIRGKTKLTVSQGISH